MMMRFRTFYEPGLAVTRLTSASASAIFVLLALGSAGEAGAQAGAPYLYISQPEEWRDGRSAIVPAGRSITIKGVAGHPSGVLRVLVNGEEAVMQQDPEYPDLYNFEKVVTAADTARVVVIRIVPRTSEPFERRYSVEPPAGRGMAVPPRDSAARPRATPPPPPAGAGEQLPNPWRGYRMRGIAYGLAAAGGAALTVVKKSETSEICEQRPAGSDCFFRTEESPAYQAPGLALIGGAVLAAVVDGLMTSRRAAAAARTSGRDDGGGGARLEYPTLSPRGEKLVLEFVRLRF
jgi:hypothetical protein